MQLHRDRERFDEAGVRLAVIGQGSPAHAADFRDKQGVDLPLLVDPDRLAYRAAGAKVATLGELVGPRSMVRGVTRGLKTGVRQGRTQGHPAQLGGVLIVAPDGTVRYSHMADDASDNAPNEEVLAAARAAAAAA